MQLQVTLLTENKKYKPVSTLVEIPVKDVVAKNFEPYKQRGLVRICAKRYWTQADLKKYGYTKLKYRIYDKQKIEEENAKRYEEIKKERDWVW